MTTQNQPQRIDWQGIGWLFLFFWYFSGLTHLLIQLTGHSIFVGFRQAFLVSSLWLVPVLLFPAHTRKLTALIGGMLWLASLPIFGYFLIYRQEFSQSVIFIIFESNVAEGSEYLQQYFAWWMPLAFLAYGLGGYWLWKQIRPVYLQGYSKVALCTVFFFTSVGYQAINQTIKKPTFAEAMETFAKRIEPAAPWQLIIGYVHYREQLSNMQALLDNAANIPPLEDFADATAGKPSTLVLVIGESTNQQRMSLYGYKRQTTPLLDALNDELVAFNNVITARPYTIEALREVLTFAGEGNEDNPFSDATIMNLMKQAGYKTYWITNQQTMTKRNTLLTMFSQQADEQVYLNNNREQNARQYDSSVFTPFEDALNDDEPRKFIVVHLLGTHMKYKYRYPEEYEIFTDRADTPSYLTDDQLEVYNSYDNAILFNDFVVANLIQRFSASDPNGFLLYLSDHGEAVFDPEKPDFIGRAEAAPSSDMYTVPFILWGSKSWLAQFPRDYRAISTRAYNTTHFIHTWSDLAGLSYKGFDATRSLVNTRFIEKKLMLGDRKRPYTQVEYEKRMPAKLVQSEAGMIAH